MNFIVPVGATEPDVVTVAVQVTLCPWMEGFGLEVSEVDGANLPVGFTTCLSPGEVLATKLASPGYLAVIVNVPRAEMKPPARWSRRSAVAMVYN